MKTIGLIGGVSYQSSLEYYRLINKKTNDLLGGQEAAQIIMISLNFGVILEAFYNEAWNEITKIMLDAARRLENSGADFIAISCNTLHKVIPAIEREIAVPFLHILEPTAQSIKKQNISCVCLLGSKFMMHSQFHKDYLFNKFQIKSITPNYDEREIINKIILDELCYGVINEKSKFSLLNIINSLGQRGAEGIILGCTELPLLLPLAPHLKIPLFNTTYLHAEAITHFALSDSLQKEMHFKKVANYSLPLTTTGG